MVKFLQEKYLHLLFEVSLIAKGAFALFEIIGGIAAYFVSQQWLLDVVRAVVQDELADDPRDFIANYFLHAAQSLSVGSLHFVGLYLMSHGVIKLWLVVGLLRKKLWYYPAAIVVFGFFVAYQLYRFSFTHSVLLLLITALDLIVIWLTWHEYHRARI